MSQKKNKQTNKVENKKQSSFDFNKYKSWIYTGIFLIIFLIFFIINNSGSEAEQGPYPPNYNKTNDTVSKLAPDFTLKTTDGNDLTLSDYKGKVVILDIWATWCPPCRRMIPDLVELKEQYGDKGFEIIGISVDQQSRADVVPFMENYKINYPIVFIDQKMLISYGGFSNIPTSLILNKNQEIVNKHVGVLPKETLEEEIKNLL
ncbi:MAG: TlpA disulfide reductase family protein [Ignavibacteria bacterium]|jgi:cytochrome c biogenesis protein CcmG/thiol:disulfide interchange protein DsbE